MQNATIPFNRSQYVQCNNCAQLLFCRGIEGQFNKLLDNKYDLRLDECCKIAGIYNESYKRMIGPVLETVGNEEGLKVVLSGLCWAVDNLMEEVSRITFCLGIEGQ